MKERADFLEERLLSQLQNAVLQPEAIEYAVQEFERQLESSLAGLDNKIGRMRQRSEEIKRELASLIANLAACRHAPAVVEAINSRQQELDDITRQLLTTEPDRFPPRLGAFAAL